jgi:hypothetical protein
LRLTAVATGRGYASREQRQPVTSTAILLHFEIGDRRYLSTRKSNGTEQVSGQSNRREIGRDRRYQAHGYFGTTGEGVVKVYPTLDDLSVYYRKGD